MCEAAALTVILLITTLIEKTLCGHCSSGPWCCATPSNAGGHFGPISVLRSIDMSSFRHILLQHSVNQVWLN